MKGVKGITVIRRKGQVRAGKDILRGTKVQGRTFEVWATDGLIQWTFTGVMERVEPSLPRNIDASRTPPRPKPAPPEPRAFVTQCMPNSRF